MQEESKTMRPLNLRSVGHKSDRDPFDRLRVRFRRCALWYVSSWCSARAAPEADSKDTVRLEMGLIGTLTALVLGLLIASAKNFYDTQSMSAKIVLLDRVLAHYGSETKEIRDLLRGAVAQTLDLLWPKEPGQHPQMEPTAAGAEILYDKIQELSPKNDTQRSLQAQALNMGIDDVRTGMQLHFRENPTIILQSRSRATTARAAMAPWHTRVPSSKRFILVSAVNVLP